MTNINYEIQLAEMYLQDEPTAREVAEAMAWEKVAPKIAQAVRECSPHRVCIDVRQSKWKTYPNEKYETFRLSINVGVVMQYADKDTLCKELVD